MIRSVMPGGIVNDVGVLLGATLGTAYCMNADQIGAAPVVPEVPIIGV